MRISDWSSDVGSSDLVDRAQDRIAEIGLVGEPGLRQVDVQRERRQHLCAEVVERPVQGITLLAEALDLGRPQVGRHDVAILRIVGNLAADVPELLEVEVLGRSEEHTSELQSLMRISYAVFC